MVGGRLKGSPCLQRADEGHTIVNALGRTSYTPQPQGPPEGFRNPAQSAPESHALGGVLMGAEARECAPKTSPARYAPRAAASSRGQRCRPRTIARSAARSRQNGTGLARKACGRTASRRWRKSTSRSRRRSSAGGGRILVRGAKKSPARAGLSLHKTSNVTLTIDEHKTSAADCTRDVMAITKVRFLGRAAPTRIRKSDGCAECPHVATSMQRPMRAAWR